MANAEELGIVKREGGLFFAQLKGMAESLSLVLSKAGFEVSEYLPFGVAEELMQYLIRRGDENQAIMVKKHPDMERIRYVIRSHIYYCDLVYICDPVFDFVTSGLTLLWFFWAGRSCNGDFKIARQFRI